MYTIQRGRAAIAIALTVAAYACGTGDAYGSDDNPIRTHMEQLASDASEGRGLGQPGLERAITYAADVLESAGLSPGFRSADGSTSFLQPVPFVCYRYGKNNQMTLEGPAGTQVLAHGSEMVIFHPGRRARPIPAGAPVFVGYGIHEPGMGYDDYAGIDVRARWILVMEGVPEWGSEELQRLHGDPAQGPRRRYDAAVQHGAAGILAIPSAQAYRYWDTFLLMRSERSIAAARDYAGGEFRDPALPVVAIREDILRATFDDTGYDPVTHEGTYATFELTDQRVSLTLDVEREELVSHNVVALVPGTDPKLRDEAVVASAHIDHLGIVGGEIYNGANDDASGCAAILEAARLIAADPQPRSVLFVLFTSEETDHLGSLHFLAEPPLQGLKIHSSINLEHVGRSGDGTFLATVSDKLQQHVEKVGASHESRLRTAPLDEEGRIVRGSDSYSFFLEGIPLVIVGGGGFPEYHSPGDDIGLIDFRMLGDAVSITVDLIREMATPD